MLYLFGFLIIHILFINILRMEVFIISCYYSAKLVYGHVVEENSEIDNLIENGDIDDNLVPYFDCNNKKIFGILISKAEDEGNYIVMLSNLDKKIEKAKEKLKSEYEKLGITNTYKDEVILVCDNGY